MSRRLNVGLVVPALDQGGGVPAVARFLYDVASHSTNVRLHIVSLVTSRTDAASVNATQPHTWLSVPRVVARDWNGVPCSHVGARYGEFEFQRYRARSALTRELAHTDLVQVVCGSPAWANAVLDLGKPVSLQTATLARVERRMRHDMGSSAVALWRRGMTAITSRLDDRALRKADAIQVENPWMLDHVRKVNVNRRCVDVRYAPPGVNTDLFRPVPMRDLSSARNILCVGRLNDPRKRVTLLLAAFAIVASAIESGVRLVLAGSAGPTSDFWAHVHALGLRDRVTFVQRPDQTELKRLYQEATVFALPSDEEGFGMVVVEAMSCGIPVVATKCGGPDGIITDGEDGYLVPRDDAKAMADRLVRLLMDPSLNLEMGAKARATVERRYDQRVAGEAFLDTWERLLHKARKR